MKQFFGWLKARLAAMAALFKGKAQVLLACTATFGLPAIAAAQSNNDQRAEMMIKVLEAYDKKFQEHDAMLRDHSSRLTRVESDLARLKALEQKYAGPSYTPAQNPTPYTPPQQQYVPNNYYQPPQFTSQDLAEINAYRPRVYPPGLLTKCEQEAVDAFERRMHSPSGVGQTTALEQQGIQKLSSYYAKGGR